MMESTEGDFLIQQRPVPNTPDERDRATRYAASKANDAGDLATLLDMLGLDPADGKYQEDAA